MKNIVLFYKKLLYPGGAERLLLKEYEYFKKSGYNVKILTFNISKDVFFERYTNNKDISEVPGKTTFVKIINLSKYFKTNKECVYLINSGYIDFYLATLLCDIKYSMHIHQPSFMSFNEKDKYSVIKRRAFDELVDSNYGSKRFLSIKRNLKFSEKIFINIRAIVSDKAVKKSKNIFVLSKYAQREKRILYGVDSYSLCGAIDSEIFDYIPNIINDYDSYEFKLLTVARLDVNKRIDDLIRGFKKFLNSFPNTILLIGGKGDELNNLIALSKELNIERNVEFLGFIPDDKLYDYYAMADVFVSIDWADYRITSYEALAVETKVLLSDETDPYEDLLNSGYYYLCKPTPEDVSDKLVDALTNKKTCSKNELIKMLNEFTWKRYFTKIESILFDDKKII